MRGFNSDEALNRVVRGTVRVMKDGNIRWSFVSAPGRQHPYMQLISVLQVSIFKHHDQWRLDNDTWPPLPVENFLSN